MPYANTSKLAMWGRLIRLKPNGFAEREFLDLVDGLFNKEMSGGGPLIDLLHMVDLALYYMDYPNPSHVLAQTFNDFIEDKGFKGPWGIPDVAEGVTDVESAAHGFVSVSNWAGFELQISWAEMNKREEVSVTFQGKKAGYDSSAFWN